MTNDATLLPGPPVRVLLADDEALIRAGVAAILATDPGIEIVAEAGNGREALDLALRFRPDVVLMDIRMPVLDGLAATRELSAALPDTAVVVLTTFGEDAYINEALQSGAAGFMLKASDPRELIAGVRAVASGGAFLSPAIAGRVIATIRATDSSGETAARDRIAGLSPRERDVLSLLGAGYSNSEIGARLFLVEGTVKGHVSSILIKLGARNRVQAAVMAYQGGVVPQG